jgi:glycosyltransferase involved in cell wall biosynthesis
MPQKIKIFSASIKGIIYSRLTLIKRLEEQYALEIFADGSKNFIDELNGTVAYDTCLHPAKYKFYFQYFRSKKLLQNTAYVPTILFNLITVLGLLFLQRLPKGKCVLVVTGLGFFGNKILLNFILRKLYNSTASIRTIVQNERDFRLITEMFKDMEVILLESSGVRSGINSSVNDSTKSINRIGYLGRITIRKGIVWLLIFQLRLAPKSQLVIAGSESLVANVILSVYSLLGVNVVRLGHVNDINYFFKKVDIFVYPANYNDGFPRVILEAWAARKLVIARNTELNRHFLGNGRLGVIANLRLKNFIPKDSRKIIERAYTKVSSMKSTNIQQRLSELIHETL